MADDLVLGEAEYLRQSARLLSKYYCPANFGGAMSPELKAHVMQSIDVLEMTADMLEARAEIASTPQTMTPPRVTVTRDNETFCIYCQLDFISHEVLMEHLDRMHPGTYRQEMG